MTFEKWVLEYCEQRGMFLNQAKQVLEMVKADEVNKGMQTRWGNSIEDYPPYLLSAISLTISENALKWIDENLPKAFYRSLFE